MVCVFLAAAIFFIPMRTDNADITRYAAAFLLIVGLGFWIVALFHRWTTEIGVTDRRVIYKRGFIARQTAEMHMDKVESVLVDQTLPGRLLNYGTITIKGTGASIENLRRIADPIGIRNAITAR
jgi:uncharacterized membrane protein YdbT with pleckstrin-like domain